MIEGMQWSSWFKHASADDSPDTHLPDNKAGDLETHIQSIGRFLLQKMQTYQQGMTDKQFWSDKLMDWATRDQTFKTQLFRFIDVFPVLGDPQLLEQHLKEYLLADGVKLPPGLGAGLKAGSWLPGMMHKTMSSQIRQMAGNFIAGTDAQDALPTLEKRWHQGIAFTLDVLGEACLSLEEADTYQQRYLDLITSLPEATQSWEDQPKLTTSHVGAVPRVNISIKVSSLHPKFHPAESDHAVSRMLDRLAPLLEAAISKDVLINFDMEQYAYKNLTLRLFKTAAERFAFHAGVVLQAYLKDTLDDAKAMIAWAKDHNRTITIRLVKGAYWDYEIAHAQSMGYPIPVYTQKSDTDANYERVAQLLLDATPRQPDEAGIHLAVGSHNVRSIAAALAYAKSIDLPENAVELQMLRGMADPLKQAAVDQGLRVREYMPIGELIPGMAYLVRRLLENTSNQSWLLAEHRQHDNVTSLLKQPVFSDEQSTKAFEQRMTRSTLPLSPAIEGLGNGGPFENEPLRDFSVPTQRHAFASAITDAKLPTVSNDTPVSAVDGVLEQSVHGFKTWRQTFAMERGKLLIKTASLMRQRRDELAGMIIREAGKPWSAADADVCEAIDFLEFYARMGVEMFEPQSSGQFIAEHNQAHVMPRGPAVIISPWNFPLAILTGMTSAALITGNTAIVKPAEQTPGIAQVMVQIMHEAGIPDDVVQLLPGVGETVGKALAQDPRIAIIAFTGSREVGLQLLQTAAQTDPMQQRNVKRLICEMGGKNAIIVDRSADLDLAVTAVRDSAFGYAGQKCSACSRLIVMDEIHDALVDRLVEATKAMAVGDPMDPSTDIGPVIDDEAAAKINRCIEQAKHEGKLVYSGELPDGLKCHGDKPFVAPHIFTDILPTHQTAQKEIFGPVLAVMRARDIDHAIDIANDSAYKLTGGLISRTPSHIQQVRDRFEVGNLYINRGITGALVARQPFGGFGFSGIGEKSGGANYLRQFVDSKIITENLLRRGFSPEGLDMGD